MTAKAVNYTPAQTADIVQRYVAEGTDVTEEAHDRRAAVVRELAIEYRGGTDGIRSIRSKLVNEGKYIPRKKVSAVTGEPAEKKEIIAARLVAAFGADKAGRTLNPDSLEKCNKRELSMILARFNAEIVDETDEPETDDTTETQVEATS